MQYEYPYVHNDHLLHHDASPSANGDNQSYSVNIVHLTLITDRFEPINESEYDAVNQPRLYDLHVISYDTIYVVKLWLAISVSYST